MKHRSLKAAGFLVMIAAALAFTTVYETVFYSFALNEFTATWDIGNWATPYRALESAFLVLAMVSFARFVVVFVFCLSVAVPRKIGIPIAAILWSTLHWWAQPLVSWLAMGTVEGTGDIFVASTWQEQWYRFGREAFYAYAAAAPIVVLAELLRRKIVFPGWVANPPADALSTPPPDAEGGFMGKLRGIRVRFGGREEATPGGRMITMGAVER